MPARTLAALAAVAALAAFGAATAQTPAPAEAAQAAAKDITIREVVPAGTPDADPFSVHGETLWLSKTAVARAPRLGQGALVDAALQTIDFAGRPRVLVYLTPDGAMQLGVLARMRPGARMALVAGGKVVALPLAPAAGGYESFIIRIDGLASTEAAIALAEEISPVKLAPRSAYANYLSADKAIAAATAKGDVAAIMKLGGTPMDVIAAQRAIIDRDPDALHNPNRPEVPLYRWMESQDRNLAAGKVPVFIQENGRTSLAQLAPDGSVISVSGVQGMNGPGIPVRGINAHIVTPDEIHERIYQERMASLPKTLDEAIAKGDPEGVSYHKGTLRQYYEAMRNRDLASGDEERAQRTAFLLERMDPNLPAPPFVTPARTATAAFAQMDAQMKEMKAQMDALPKPR